MNPIFFPMRPNAVTKQLASTCRRFTPWLAFFFVWFALVTATSAAFASQPETEPNDQQIIHGIDAAVLHRTAAISSYTVQEIYSLYRNGEAAPSSQVTVKTVYNRGTGKDYIPVSQTGSSLLRTVVVDKVLANEKEMAKATNRDSVSLTSANYEMHPLPGIVSRNGHDCIIVELKARRKIPYLFNGKGWFNASDFALVHIEGSPAASPSFFAGTTTGVRDYTRVDGFSMAQQAQLHSHSLLFGDTVLKIEYSDYQIQLESKSPAGN